MNKARDIRNIALGAVVAASGLSALAAVNLTSFSPGTPIKSSEVNANFSSLKANIEALQAPGSVDATRLAVSGSLDDGKVLKLSGGKLTWGDDLVGTGGGTFTADGTSLALSGTTFSIKDAGVSTSKLADGAVTAAKLSFPFSASGNFGFTGLFLTNTTASGGAIALAGRSGSGAGLNITTPVGVLGESQSGIGVVGGSANSIGVQGNSQSSVAVRGQGHSGAGLSISGSVGVLGESDTGIGIIGASSGSIGILGRSASRGIVGTQGSLALSCGGTYAVGGCAESSGIGVLGRSVSGYAVYGESTNNNAVYGVSVGSNTNAAAVAGTSASGYAAYFEAGNGSGGFATCTFHAGTTNWACSSDRNLKNNFRPVNTARVLEAVAKMPVTTWNMKGSTIRQLGPTAQDFYAAFHLGTSDKSINNTDVQGVALAAIKGMYQKNRALENQVKTLSARLAALEKAVGSR